MEVRMVEDMERVTYFLLVCFDNTLIVLSVHVNKDLEFSYLNNFVHCTIGSIQFNTM